jgi:arsenate reductase
MSVAVYHNPRCGTSRTVLAMLRKKGIEPQVIEYLVTPPDRAALTALLARMGITPRELLRRRDTPYDDLDLDNAKWSDNALIDFIVQHPILMDRPVVVTAKGARICRPAEVVNTLI